MSEAFFPNTTQFPDFLLDYWMAEVDHAEWKVLCYIVRHTYGFRKTMDALSMRQFTHGMRGADGNFLNNGCGIKSHSTLCRALQSLEERGLIRRYAQPAEKGKNTPVTRYELTFKEVAVDTAKLRLVVGGGVRSQNTPPVCDERTPGVLSSHTGCAMREHTTPTLTTPIHTTLTEASPPYPPYPPAVAHERGEVGEGESSQSHMRDEPPPIPGTLARDPILAQIEKIAPLLEMPLDDTLIRDWRPHVRDFLRDEPADDLYNCLAWMLTQDHWQGRRDQGDLKVMHVRSKLAGWRKLGRPTTFAPPKKTVPSHQQPAAALSAPDAYSGGRFGLCSICGSRPCAPDCPQQEHPDPRAAGLPPFSTRGEGE